MSQPIDKNPINDAYAAYLEAMAKGEKPSPLPPHNKGEAILKAEDFGKKIGEARPEDFKKRGHNLWVTEKTWVSWPRWFRMHVAREFAEDTGNFSLPYPTFALSHLDKPTKWTENGGGVCADEHAETTDGPLFYYITEAPIDKNKDADAWLVTLHELGHAMRKDDFWFRPEFFSGRDPLNPDKLDFAEECSAEFAMFLMSRGTKFRSQNSLKKMWVENWLGIGGDDKGGPYALAHACAPFLSGLIKFSEYDDAIRVIKKLAAHELHDSSRWVMRRDRKSGKHVWGVARMSDGERVEKAIQALERIPTEATGDESIKRRLLLGYAAAIVSRHKEKDVRKTVRNEPLLEEILATKWKATPEELVELGKKNPFLWQRMAKSDRPDMQAHAPAPRRPAAAQPAIPAKRAQAA